MEIWSLFAMVVVSCEFPSWFAYTRFIPSCRSAKGLNVCCIAYSVIIIIVMNHLLLPPVIISLVAVRPKAVVQELAN